MKSFGQGARAYKPRPHETDRFAKQGATALLSKQSVLIIDRSEENRTVLRAALERRGVEILEADRGDVGLQMAAEYQPDLIVLDLEADEESGNGPDGVLRSPWDEPGPAAQTPLVILGSVRRDGGGPVAEYVNKPYHYGPLIRRIEMLLQRSREDWAN
jgi:two-component system KDP operon response regulator KdpE